MSFDSIHPRRTPVEKRLDPVSQLFHAELSAECLAAPTTLGNEVFVMAKLGDPPPARLEPYISDGRSIRDLLRSIPRWQPGGDAGRVEVLVAAWQFMEGLYQASRGGDPARPNQENPQAAQNRQAFQDAVNWAFQQVGSSWQMDDLDNEGHHTYSLNGEGRRVRIRSGNETTTIELSRDLQDQLRTARSRAATLADAIIHDIPGAQPNLANVRTTWRDIRGNARIAAFILYFANLRLHEQGYHLERNGNNLLIKRWDTTRSTAGDTLHTIN